MINCCKITKKNKKCIRKKDKKIFEEINNKYPLYHNNNKDIHLNSISLSPDGIMRPRKI